MGCVYVRSGPWLTSACHLRGDLQLYGTDVAEADSAGCILRVLVEAIFGSEVVVETTR